MQELKLFFFIEFFKRSTLSFDDEITKAWSAPVSILRNSRHAENDANNDIPFCNYA